MRIDHFVRQIADIQIAYPYITQHTRIQYYNRELQRQRCKNLQPGK
jgi:hypothetical protein